MTEKERILKLESDVCDLKFQVYGLAIAIVFLLLAIIVGIGLS